MLARRLVDAQDFLARLPQTAIEPPLALVEQQNVGLG